MSQSEVGAIREGALILWTLRDLTEPAQGLHYLVFEAPVVLPVVEVGADEIAKNMYIRKRALRFAWRMKRGVLQKNGGNSVVFEKKSLILQIEYFCMVDARIIKGVFIIITTITTKTYTAP